MQCRFCKTELKHVFIDLGSSPASNSFLSADQLNALEPFSPLKVYPCHNCFLVQVDEYKKSDTIFDSNYVYFSSYSRSWLEHARKYTNQMIERFGFNENSLVVEIASNDGYLLQYFKAQNVPVLGIEPTANTAAVATEKGINSVVDFFGVQLAAQLAAGNRKADLLLGNNVLAHVPDIIDFVKGMAIALKDNGIITMEFPHLIQLVANNQFDTIYHEHFSYLSFTTVNRIFNEYGLELFDVEEIPTHGGSLRIYAKHKNDISKNVEKSVQLMLDKEQALGVSSLSYYTNFQQKAEKIRTDLLHFLKECKHKGKKVCAYGAAAKGNTLLNYCDIKADLIPFVVDASPHKIGKYLPGSKIPVVSEKRISEDTIDYIIIFPWNIKDEIINQLSYVKKWDGQFVIAIPELKFFQ